jgi:replicative DNA helicase
LLLQWARTFANDGKRPLVFSLEMRTRENMNRILAAESRTNSRLFRGVEQPTCEQVARIMAAHHRLRNGPPAWMNDRPETTPSRLTSEARRYARKHGMRVALVDYLQLLRPTNPREPRHQQVGEAARALKLLARNQNIVVVCAAQLNREIEGRNDATPRLSDLRDSGEIEQHADFVFFLHGDGDKQHEPEETIKLICGKGRSVPAGYVLPLHWDKPRMTFREALPNAMG